MVIKILDFQCCGVSIAEDTDVHTNSDNPSETIINYGHVTLNTRLKSTATSQ